MFPCSSGWTPARGANFEVEVEMSDIIWHNAKGADYMPEAVKAQPKPKILPPTEPKAVYTKTREFEVTEAVCPACNGIKQEDGKTHRLVGDVAGLHQVDYGVCPQCQGTGIIEFEVLVPEKVEEPEAGEKEA